MARKVMNRPGQRLIPLEAREVPLGGLRAMSVQRVLPYRDLPTIGAWCFVDRFGPQRVTMRVDPHPHTGLQTVTWPLTGRIRHRDTLGVDTVLDVGQAQPHDRGQRGGALRVLAGLR
ncbi:hypothetical protein GCM10025876_05260 [Demequina litorisediminis]|uniref:Pirin N-terminal domain-containing protein n=2 Tax=Demequina litorisediminis TaxID=1849022 RepID=A0ABQ6IAY1_9MICO|nr:hypothetical protein GCM10025876_05260 [Demequina litorisediminis]